MIEKINTPKFAGISKPSLDAIEILKRAKKDSNQVVAAEIGVGIGATTLELLKVMDGSGSLHLFDYFDILNELVQDIEDNNLSKGVEIIKHGNTMKTFDSYAWSLSNLILKLKRDQMPLQLFDFVYLDGAHSFHHDAPALVTLKELVKINGYIVIDDVFWTFKHSPTMNPVAHPKTLDYYNDEQIEVPHVERIIKIFMEDDPRFKQIQLHSQLKAPRAVFQKIQ